MLRPARRAGGAAPLVPEKQPFIHQFAPQSHIFSFSPCHHGKIAPTKPARKHKESIVSYPAQTSRPRHHGFTLIEMLVVLAVAAALLVIGMPALRDLLVRNQFASVSNEFTGLVASARSNAIKSNRSITLCRAASSTATACDNSADNQSQAWAYWLIIASDNTIVGQGAIPYADGGNVTLTSANIRFNAAGNLARDLPAQPTVGSDKQCRTMSLYRSGTIYPKTASGACS